MAPLNRVLTDPIVRDAQPSGKNPALQSGHGRGHLKDGRVRPGADLKRRHNNFVVVLYAVAVIVIDEIVDANVVLILVVIGLLRADLVVAAEPVLVPLEVVDDAGACGKLHRHWARALNERRPHLKPRLATAWVMDLELPVVVPWPHHKAHRRADEHVNNARRLVGRLIAKAQTRVGKSTATAGVQPEVLRCGRSRCWCLGHWS
mmetsp:Transcript_26898/g.70668  ORF Transcript_26898/g.70668 Transcript_26898/m.70668 type:complete len:204 (+) Transcript_26898:1622-2233(+)